MALFDSKTVLNHAIRYLADAAQKRAAGGWIPPKEQERQQRDAMRQEQQQARQAERAQKEEERQLKAIGGGSFSGTKMPSADKLAKLADKFIYHSGTVDQLDNMKWGLEPQHGDWVKEVAAGAIEDPDEMLNRSVPLVWMSDHPSWVAGKVSRKLGKHVKDVTEDDIRKHGHLAMIPRKGDHAEHIWRVGDEGLNDGPYSTVTNLNGKKAKAYETDLYDSDMMGQKEPFGVEKNEYISARPVEPMFHLTGDDLVTFLKHTNQLPQKSEGGLILSKQFPTHYMPNVGRQVMMAGGVPDDQPQRQLSPMGFYSAAAERASTLQPSGDAVQMVNALKNTQGIKTEELQNAGLIDQSGNVHPDWAGRGKVTRDELVSHLQGQMPQVEETMLGGYQPFDSKKLTQLENEYAQLKQHPIDDPSFGEDKYNEMIRLMNIRDQSSADSLYKAAEEAMLIAQRSQRRGNMADAEKMFREHELLNTRAEKLELQGQGLENPTKYSQYTLPGGENYREVLLKLPQLVDPTKGRYTKTESGMWRVTWADGDTSVFKTEQQAKDAIGSVPAFRSAHWDDPNVLAHIRMADRTGPNGEKILHVEELQSDWGQKGKKEGFKNQAEFDAWKKNHDDAAKEVSDKRKQMNDYFNDPSRKPQFVGGEMSPREYDFTLDHYRESLEQDPKFLALRDAYRSANQQYVNLQNTKPKLSGVASAPYVTSTEGWTDLALKRVLKEAAEGGYDKIVWTPGAEQAKRYDLSKQIDGLQYVPKTNTLYAYQNGRVVINKTAKPEELEDVVGKDVAKKLLSSKLDDYGVGNLSHYIEGQDLSVGGEGMKGYYDSIVPKRLQNLAKKHDKNARLGFSEASGTGRYEVVLPNGKVIADYPDKVSADAIARRQQGATVRSNNMSLPSLDITPAMRESILRGQSAYKRGGTVSKRHPALSIAGTHIREEEHGEPMFTGRL